MVSQKKSVNLIFISLVILVIGGAFLIASLWSEMKQKETAFEAVSAIESIKTELQLLKTANTNFETAEKEFISIKEEFEVIKEQLTKINTEYAKQIDVENLDKRIKELEEKNKIFSNENFLKLNALYQLRFAISSEKAYTVELNILKKLDSEETAFETLEQTQEGLPTITALTEEFKNIQQQMNNEKKEKGIKGVWVKIKNLIRIQKINTDSSDTSTPAIMQRIEKNLTENNLNKVVVELETLKTTDTETFTFFEAWNTKINQRQNTLKTLDELTQKYLKNIKD